MIDPDDYPKPGDRMSLGCGTVKITRVVKLESGLLQIHYAKNALERFAGGRGVIHINPRRDPADEEAA